MPGFVEHQHPGKPQQLSRQSNVNLQEISRYLRNPHKPAILAMSRPDPKKNITTLVKAFGENKTLRSLANLVLIMVYPFCMKYPAA